MQKLCRFCLKTYNKNGKKMDEVTIEIMNILLLGLNLDIIEEPALCGGCAEYLQKCFDFKSACFYVEDFIFPFVNLENNLGLKLDLRELLETFVMKQHQVALELLPVHRICRFCIELLTDEAFIPLCNIDEDMLQKCVPELNLNIIKSPVICNTCHESLKDFSGFINTCVETEEKISNYCGVKGFNTKGKVALTKVVQFLKDGNQCNPKIITEPECVLKPKNVVSIHLSRHVKESTNDCQNLDFKKNCKPTCPKLSNKNPSKIQWYNSRYCNHKDPSEIQWYKCDSCTYKSKCKSYLKRHVLKHKDFSRVKTFRCKKCPYIAKHQNYLSRHILTHTDPTKRQLYECYKCHHKLSNKRSLKKHMLLHKDLSEVQWHQCESCGYRSQFKSYLKEHVLIHKDFAEVVTFRCDKCTYKTKLRSNLTRHKLIHTDPSKRQTYKCSHCSHKTTVKGNLKRHMMLHKKPSETL